MSIVEVQNLTKVYKTAFKGNLVTALDNFDLTVNEATIFGLLGKNGAGKTTFVKVLLGIIFPTQGSVKVLSRNPRDYTVRRKIGYLPENHKIPPFLTGESFLHYFGKMAGVDDPTLKKRIPELIDLVRLTRWEKKKIKTYSKGMMQRIGLAQALIHDPELLLLDEPTDGIDPVGRKEIRDILVDLKSKKKTIFINSHILSEVELITDRVAIIDKGKLLQEGKVEDLTRQGNDYLIKSDSDIGKIISADENSYYALMRAPEGDIIRVNDDAELNKFIDLMRSKNILIKEIIHRKKTLEEIFISTVSGSDGGAK
ncbi:MAG: ABC transporter ATP-binding protein [Ignavibacteriaceae bacterium]|nr:ABC transporter ATP-binding protein [Ignavibacteriaceae bacterium]